MFKITLSNLVVLTLIFLLAPKTAQAYIDPGSGSFIIQIIVAGLVGIMLTARTFWHNSLLTVKKIFARKKINDRNE